MRALFIVLVLTACGSGSVSGGDGSAGEVDGSVGDDDDDDDDDIDAGALGDASVFPDATWPSATDRYGCDTGRDPRGGRFLYVDAAAPPGGDGASIGAPLRSIADAFDAVDDGDRAVICVAEGTYTEHVGDAADTFGEGTEYVLVGGFVAGSAFTARDSAVAVTRVVAPDRGAATITFGNVAAFTVDGFELRGGHHGIEVVAGYAAGRRVRVLHSHIVDNGVDGESQHQGAGMLITGTDVVIAENLVEGNHGGRLGAGIYLGSAASADENQRDPDSGALIVGPALAVIADNVVRDNTLRHDTPHGVGIAVSMNARIERNVVVANIGYPVDGGGDAVGGGIFVQNQDVTALVTRNLVVDNVALHGGAGIFIDEAAIATIADNVLFGNQGHGAIAIDGRASGDVDRGWGTVVHNTVVGNDGGGLYVQDSTAAVYDNLFADNGEPDLQAAVGGDQEERIIADHNRFVGTSGVASAFELGEHNLTAACPLVDAIGSAGALDGDWRLAAGSPCRDAGVASFDPAYDYPGAPDHGAALDFAAAARPQGGGPDLGALEGP